MISWPKLASRRVYIDEKYAGRIVLRSLQRAEHDPAADSSKGLDEHLIWHATVFFMFDPEKTGIFPP